MFPPWDQDSSWRLRGVFQGPLKQGGGIHFSFGLYEMDIRNGHQLRFGKIHLPCHCEKSRCVRRA